MDGEARWQFRAYGNAQAQRVMSSFAKDMAQRQSMNPESLAAMRPC